MSRFWDDPRFWMVDQQIQQKIMELDYKREGTPEDRTNNLMEAMRLIEVHTPEIGKIAIKNEIWKLDNGPKVAWFQLAGFRDVPEDLSNLRKDLRGFEISSRPDGYGHRCGVNMEIDWMNRRFVKIGWSSDD